MAFLASSTLLFSGCRAAPVTETVVKGEPVAIDRLYPPGQGPTISQQFVLQETYPQRLWLTGADVAVRDSETNLEVDGLLSGLTVGFQDAVRHSQLSGMSGLVGPSLFHTGAGLRRITLPEGYGIPTMSNELMHVSSVWQNRDLYRKPLSVRTDVTVRYLADSDSPPKELRVYPVFVTVTSEPHQHKADGKPHPHLHPYDPDPLQPNGEGKPSAGRWWIPPGRSEARSLVSFALPTESELTARFATAYVYEDWSRLELYDLTSDRSLIVFTPGQSLERPFLDGLTLDTRHRLELRVAYQNPSPTNHVGAAMIVLYVDPPASATPP